MRDHKRKLGIRKKVLAGYECLVTTTVNAGRCYVNNHFLFSSFNCYYLTLESETIRADYQEGGQSM